MDKSLNKIMFFAFVCAGFMAGYVLSVFIDIATNSSGAAARLFSSQGLKQGLPLITGIGLFMILSLTPSVKLWATEVISEIGKIVWPSRRDTTSMTIAVTMIILMSAVLFFVFDQISLWLVKQIIAFKWFKIFESLGF